VEAERARDKLRIELDRRESDLRLRRGLAHRFNVILPGGSCSSSDCPQSAPVTHRGEGAFIDAPRLQGHWLSSSQSSTSGSSRLTETLVSTSSASGELPLAPTTSLIAQPTPVPPQRRNKCLSANSGCSLDEKLPVIGDGGFTDGNNATNGLNCDSVQRTDNGR
jgi:hypothetical protein